MSAKRKATARPRAEQKPQPQFLPPLRPRRWLVVVLGILVLLWLAFLMFLRLKTVHA